MQRAFASYHQATGSGTSSHRLAAHSQPWCVPLCSLMAAARAKPSTWLLSGEAACKRASLCSCQAEASTSAPAPAPPPAKRKRASRKRTAKPDSAALIVEPQQQSLEQPQPIVANAVSLEQELALQERENDLTVEDLMQLHYEVPTDEQISKDIDEFLDDEQQWSSGPSSEVPKGAADTGSETPPTISRKAAILLEIIAAAAGSELDSKIAQFIDDVDDELLELLQRRIDMVAKVNSQAADQLRELAGVLRVVHRRQQASPAARLLDDVLDMLGEDMTDTQAYSSRRMEAMARIREAFQGGASPGLDIFAAAAALAEAGPLAAAELAGEAVDPVEFVTEATQTLDEARRGQQQLGQDIERADKEIRYLQKHKPDLLQGPQAAQHMSQLTQARHIHASRAVALSQLQDVLLMARQVMADRRFLQDQ